MLEVICYSNKENQNAQHAKQQLFHPVTGILMESGQLQNLPVSLTIIYQGNAQPVVYIIYVGSLLKYNIDIVKCKTLDLPVLSTEKNVITKAATPFVITHHIYNLIFSAYPVGLSLDKTLAYILVITHALKK